MPHVHLLLALERLTMARIVVADLLRRRLIVRRKALQRNRDRAYLPLLWLPVAFFMSLVVGLEFLVCHGYLGLEQRCRQRRVPYRGLFMIATIGLFDLSVRDVDPRTKEGGDLLQQEVLLLFCLKLARRNGWDVTAQDELIAGGAKLPVVLEKGHASNGIVQLLLRHHHTVLLGHAQEDRPGCQLFEGHLTEVKAFVEVHIRLGTKDGTIALLQRVVHALEFAHVDQIGRA